jgi:SAM-dependent methyltransferase
MLIACYNAPKNNTISGDEYKIDALKALLDADKVFARKLNVLNAYHSGHVKALADEYLELMSDVSFGDRLPSADIYMFSSVNGQKVEKDTLDAQYWVDNMVSPVRFTDALLAMSFARLSKGQASLRLNASAENIFADTIVEIGPHAALQGAIKDTLATKVSSSSVSYLSVLNRISPGVHTILNTAGFLSSHGSLVDILAVNESANPSASAPRTLVRLPPYSFKHSEKVWYESRLSKNYRLRKYPRHDLFGAPVPDWNSESPRWRHIIRLSEQPWLRDHLVTDSFVYPGVGYLIAVIEASRQIADPEMKIAGYRLRDVSLKRALIVPDNKEGIEISLSLTRMDESSLWGSSVWKKFQISSYNPLGEGDWIEHCTGYISVDYETSPGPVDAGRESVAEAAKWKETLEDVKQRCVVPFDIDSTYDNLITCGLTFGPLFKNLSDVKGTADARGEVTGLVTVPDIAAAMPKGFAHPHLIHPATMDSMIHLFITSVMDHIGKNSLHRAMVPIFMKDVWISAEVNNTPSHTFRGHGKSTLLAYDKYQSDIMVWDGTTDEARISIKGIRAASLESVDSGPSEARKLCHTIEWKLDADLLNPSSFPDVVHVTEDDNLDYKHWINRFQLGALLRVTDALSVLGDFNPEVLQGHFIKYWNWMKQLEEWLQADQISGMKLSEWTEYNNSPSLKAELYEEIAAHNADGRLAMRMGSNIPQVLRKEVDPLHLMFGQDDLLDQVYEQVVKLGDLPALQQAYLEIIAHNCTNLRILEVGAGTGSSTAAMLDGLAQSSDDGKKKASRIEKYTFTDVSSGFFEKAKEKFKAFRNIMEYRALNVEKDVSGQGFDLKSYDFIVAGNVIHATADLKKTLTNLRGLLKPGGKLILHEGIRQDYLWSNISFGQLPGWWLGVEPIREWSPWITPKQWDGILKEAGFSGVDLNLADREDPNLHTQSLLIGTAVNPSAAEPSGETQTVIVTTTPPSESPSELTIALKSYLESNLRIPSVSTVHYLDLATTDLSKSVCISIIELEHSVLSTLTEAEYDNIRQLLVTCAGMIWITGDTLADPSFNMIAGLTRTVRWERDIDDVNLVTLSVCEPKPAVNDLVSSIGRLYGQQFIATLPANQMNGEYMLRSTSFLSARLIDSDAGNDYLSSKSLRPKPVLQEFGKAGRPVKLATASPGQLDKLEWVTDPIYAEPLDETHVEIEIKAVGLNFRDLMIAMGEHMAYSFGNEAAGKFSVLASG